MSLFMNNRLIVSKQYHRVFWLSKYCIASILFRVCRLLELDGCRRLTGAIIEHAVHMLDLIDDAAGDSAQNIPGHIIALCGHKVGGGHSTQRHSCLLYTSAINAAMPDFCSAVVVSRMNASRV